MFRKISLLLVLVVFSIAGLEGQLKFSCRMDKILFLEGEKVFCIMELENNTPVERTTLSLRPVTGGITIEVIDVRTQDKLKYTGVQFTTTGKSKLTLRPGAQVLEFVELNEMYGKRMGSLSAHQYLAAGSYKIEASFDDGEGSVLSSSANFEVKKPEGQEAAAYNILADALRRKESDDKGFVQKAANLSRLETDHPNSVYTPIAMMVLAAWYKFRLNDEQKSNETYVRLVEKYPTAVKMAGVVHAALSTFGTSPERRAFLDKLISRTTDSLAVRYLKQRPEIEVGK